MSAEGSLPAAPQPRPTGVARLPIRALLVCAGMVSACNGSTPDSQVLASETAPDAAHVALVKLIPCAGGWCESLWLGSTAASSTRVVTLPRGEEHCDEIAWSRDGKRVAFLINGYQLRLYNPQTHAPAGLIDVVPPDSKPTTRIARGITFSDNGAAITFDDCPRDRSGCRPGLLAVR